MTSPGCIGCICIALVSFSHFVILLTANHGFQIRTLKKTENVCLNSNQKNLQLKNTLLKHFLGWV